MSGNAGCLPDHGPGVIEAGADRAVGSGATIGSTGFAVLDSARRPSLRVAQTLLRITSMKASPKLSSFFGPTPLMDSSSALVPGRCSAMAASVASLNMT